MKKIEKLNQAELAAYIQLALAKEGIHMILTGGAVVAIYTKGQYSSLDIDLVGNGFESDRVIKLVMKELGFSRPGKHFTHPKSKYLVEFVAGPPSVGEEPIRSTKTLSLSSGKLKMISPTDCVKDRLAAFFYWHDRNSLKQAVMVARAQHVKQSEIKGWAKKEGKENEYQVFLELLKETQ